MVVYEVFRSDADCVKTLCVCVFRHGSLTGAQQQLIRETLMKWLQSQVSVY